jgi:hypothetical protein
MDKMLDPQYSRLVSEFTDSPKNGLGIKLYSKQAAFQIMAKLQGMITDKTDITSGGKPIEGAIPNERFDIAISTLADAIREALPHPDAGQAGAVDTPKQTPMAGVTEPGG